MGQFFNVHSDDISSFALSAGTTGVLALALISSVAVVIGDFAAVVAVGAAWLLQVQRHQQKQ